MELRHITGHRGYNLRGVRRYYPGGRALQAIAWRREPSVGHRVGVMKILYVEDNAANARLVAKYLGLKGDITLLEAATAEEGLVLARESRPDLILMDLNLPRMSGGDALRALRADSVTRDIVVVAVSADAVPDNIRAAMASGFDDYLTKPLDFRRFDRIIDRYRPALARKRPANPG